MMNPSPGTVTKRASKTARRHTLLPAQSIVEKYEHRDVGEHPFFAWLASRPVDMTSLWFLLANLRAGISQDFVRWLATAIERTDDRRVASILAKQLNDELGNGDFNQIHSLLLDRFLAGFEPWKPKRTHNRTLLPGRRLAEKAGALFHAADPFEGLGALMVGEIFAKKMDHCLGDQIRRQNDLSEEALRWLFIHETLEVDHADDSLELAILIPKRDAVLEPVWRGANAQWDVLWEFLDGVAALTMDAKPAHEAFHSSKSLGRLRSGSPIATRPHT